MSSANYILYLTAILLFCACADTKSNKTNATDKAAAEKSRQEKIRDSLREALQIPSDGNASDYDIDITSIETVKQEELIPFLKEYGKKNSETQVRISTDFGDIEVKLYNDTPLHRANFIRLVKLSYFNTTYFHRVANNFVVQGGNSDTRATQQVRHAVGSFLIPNEFKSKYTHKRGAFAAAKYSKQNVSKASSPFEFYIVQSKKGAHHLDNDHTVFGEVVKGMDVIDKIAKVPVGEREWPKRDIPLEVKVLP